MKVQLIAHEMNIEHLCGGPIQFMKRNNLSVCNYSVGGQKLLNDWGKKKKCMTL